MWNQQRAVQLILIDKKVSKTKQKLQNLNNKGKIIIKLINKNHWVIWKIKGLVKMLEKEYLIIIILDLIATIIKCNKYMHFIRKMGIILQEWECRTLTWWACHPTTIWWCILPCHWCHISILFLELIFLTNKIWMIRPSIQDLISQTINQNQLKKTKIISKKPMDIIIIIVSLRCQQLQWM